MAVHPVLARVQTFPPSSDARQTAERLIREWDMTVLLVEALPVGDAEAEQVLRQASEQLSTIQQFVGLVHGWHLRQQHFIHRHARRLFGEQQLLFNKPGWTEAY